MKITSIDNTRAQSNMAFKGHSHCKHVLPKTILNSNIVGNEKARRSFLSKLLDLIIIH